LLIWAYDHGQRRAIPIVEIAEKRASQESRDWKALSHVPEEYQYHVYAMCLKYDVPVGVFCALVHTESSWKHETIGRNSDSFDIGFCQLNSKNKKYFEDVFDGYDVYNPLHNIEIGAWFLRQMYDQHKSWTLAMAAYNAGSSAVHNGTIPQSTKKYVHKIWSWVQKNLKDSS